mgnify:FL=1
MKICVNIKTLSDALAYDAMIDEMFRCEYITDESEVYKKKNTFTEQAQPIYDRWYSYFEKMILLAKI